MYIHNSIMASAGLIQ